MAQTIHRTLPHLRELGRTRRLLRRRGRGHADRTCSAFPRSKGRGRNLASESATSPQSRFGRKQRHRCLRLCWRGPSRTRGSGKPLVNGEELVGEELPVQRADKLRAAGDLKRSSANSATASHFPINRPSRGHIAQLCGSYRFRGYSRPSALAEADHGDAYEQLALFEKGEFSAVVPRRHPKNRFYMAPWVRCRRVALELPPQGNSLPSLRVLGDSARRFLRRFRDRGVEAINPLSRLSPGSATLSTNF